MKATERAQGLTAGMKSTASAFKGFQKKYQDMSVSEMPADVRDKIIFLKDEDLLDDPFNEEYYGENDVSGLSETMKIYGFQGVILAYPQGEKGKYMIEAGHRRRAAARQAGITEYPVFVTKPPVSIAERKLRLLNNNLHAREYNPMQQAKVAEGLYKAHEEDIREKKRSGKLVDGETTAINQLVANDMEVSTSTAEKYRMLLKLITPLQELAASGEAAWSALAQAARLSEVSQGQLYQMICEKKKTEGARSVRREWIERAINSLKENTAAAKPKKESSKRTYITSKMMVKKISQFSAVLTDETVIKDEGSDEALKALESLKEKIDLKIKELQK